MDAGGARFKFKKMKYEEFEEEWAKPCDFRSRFYLEGELRKNISSKLELNAKSNSLPLDDAPSCIESMKIREIPRKIGIDLNSEDVSSSECGSTCGFTGEKDSMRIWKQMKQNGFLSSSNGGVLVPQMPKPRGRKRGIESINKKIEIAKKEQVDKFAKVAAPSGLLNDLNPGIINHVRNRRQVHSIIENLVRSSRNKTKISKNDEDDVLALKLSSDSTMASENISSLSIEESGNMNISTVDSLSVKAASVACQWLELVHQDIKGRLAALRRSKKRVQSVTQTELPFLISMELYSPVGIEMHRFRWSALFDQMDKSLSEEEEHLEKSLNQVREMLSHCQHGLFPFPPEIGLQHNYIYQKVDRDLAVRAAAAAIYSTSSFLQSAENLPEMVMVDDISFPPHITTTKPLSLLGHGITDIEIHFLQIKFTAIGVYIDPEIVAHLQKWKGKSATELAGDDEFFDCVISAPVDKYLRIVVIKEIKGSQYGVQLESAVRDRLAADDKYEEEEEEALNEIVEFLQAKYFKKDSVLTFSFPAESNVAEIGFSSEGKEEPKTMKVENGNVVEMLKKWYLGGTSAYSPSTILSLANTFSLELSK